MQTWNRSWRTIDRAFHHSSRASRGISSQSTFSRVRCACTMSDERAGTLQSAVISKGIENGAAKQTYDSCTTRIVSVNDIPDLPTGRNVTDAEYRQVYHRYVSQAAEHSHQNRPSRPPDGQNRVTCSATNAHLLSCAITSLTAGIAPPVAFPTETVYGLGADATNAASIAGIFAAKGRPSDNPLIVHVSSVDHLERCFGGSEKQSAIPGVYKDLVEEFWPGPLTILLPLPEPGKGVAFAHNVHPGQETIGFRVPESAHARFIIAAANRPIAAPSANSSGKPSPTAASHVKDDLDGKINFILDGGECNIGVESTVVDGLGQVPLILRPGGLSKLQLKNWGKKMNNVWQHVENGWDFKRPAKSAVSDRKSTSTEQRPSKRQRVESGDQHGVDMFESPAVGSPASIHEDLLTSDDSSTAPRAPGMKYKHYAPSGRLILVERQSQSASTSTQPAMEEILGTVVRTHLRHASLKNDLAPNSQEKGSDVRCKGDLAKSSLHVAVLPSSSWSFQRDAFTSLESDYELEFITGTGPHKDVAIQGHESSNGSHSGNFPKPRIFIHEFRLGTKATDVARNLFACLRACDREKCTFILAETPYHEDQDTMEADVPDGEYETVLERMRKAASEVISV